MAWAVIAIVGAGFLLTVGVASGLVVAGGVCVVGVRVLGTDSDQVTGASPEA